GDVRHDRHRRAPYLIAQAEIRSKLTSVGEFIDWRREYSRFLPSLDLFKLPNSHGNIVAKGAISSRNNKPVNRGTEEPNNWLTSRTTAQSQLTSAPRRRG